MLSQPKLAGTLLSFPIFPIYTHAPTPRNPPGGITVKEEPRDLPSSLQRTCNKNHSTEALHHFIFHSCPYIFIPYRPKATSMRKIVAFTRPSTSSPPSLRQQNPANSPYASNRNFTASNLPRPSRGATFLLLYEFVKSCNNPLTLLTSPA